MKQNERSVTKICVPAIISYKIFWSNRRFLPGLLFCDYSANQIGNHREDFLSESM